MTNKIKHSERARIQRAITEALGSAAETIEAGGVVRGLVELATTTLEQDITVEEMNVRGNRLMEGTPTAALEDARLVFRTLRKLAEIHERALTRYVYERWKEGDRTMTQDAQTAFKQYDDSGDDDPAGNLDEDGPQVVVILGGPPRELARDTIGQPIMPPSKHVQ